MSSRPATANTSGPGERDDAALLAAAVRRDPAAFAELVSRYYKPVYRVVWRMTNGAADCEDLTQDAFLKLWRDPAQVREAAALKGWLMRVASNAVIDRSRRPAAAAIELIEEMPDTNARPDAPLQRSQAARRVDAAVAALPDRQRLAVTLVYFEGCSNIEAAAAMDASVDAVESLLARARRNLKSELNDTWNELLDGLTMPGT